MNSIQKMQKGGLRDTRILIVHCFGYALIQPYSSITRRQRSYRGGVSNADRKSSFCSRHAIKIIMELSTSRSSRPIGECPVCLPPWKRLLRTRQVAMMAFAISVWPFREASFHKRSASWTSGGSVVMNLTASSVLDPDEITNQLLASFANRFQSGAARPR